MSTWSLFLPPCQRALKNFNRFSRGLVSYFALPAVLSLLTLEVLLPALFIFLFLHYFFSLLGGECLPSLLVSDEHVLTLPISKSKDMYELEFRATAPNEIRRKLDKEKGMVQSQRSSAMRLAAMTRTSRCWVSPQVCPERLWRFEDKVLSIHERCNVLLPRQVLPITLCLYPCDDVSWAEPFMCSRLEGGRAVVGYSEKERSVVASVECSPQTLLRFLKAEWASLMTLGGERGSA